MNEIDLETEKELVAQVIDEWLDGWSRKDAEVIMEFVANDFVLHMSENPASIGLAALRDFVQEYSKLPLGPVTHEVSRIEVSASGDMAYEIGTHHHVVIEGSGSQYVEPWNHLIVLKKINGQWKIIAISETNIKPTE